jgi:hypothetical protein
MRWAGGINRDPPAVLTSLTNSMMACFGGPSFHDGSGSSVWASAKEKRTSAKQNVRKVQKIRFISSALLGIRVFRLTYQAEAPAGQASCCLDL